MNDMNAIARAERTTAPNGLFELADTPIIDSGAGPLQNAEFAELTGAPVASQGAEPPQNSEIMKVVEDVLGALEYSFAAVAANPGAEVRPESVEAEMKRYLQDVGEQQRAKYFEVARELVSASEPVRVATFGRAGRRGAAEHVGLKGFAQFDDGLDPLKIDRKLLGVRPPEITLPLDAIERVDDRLVIRRDAHGGSEMPIRAFESASSMDERPVGEERLAEIWGDYREADALTDFEGARLDKVAFNVERVRCIDETNPERTWFINYHDEIAIGGQSIDEDGDVKLISERFVGGGFDDGDQRTYNPSWRMHMFGLNEGRSWPKDFRVVLSLAEKDHGSFQKFLDRVYNMIRVKVATAIKNAVGGVLTPYLGPVLGALIGTGVAYVVDRFVKRVIRWFGDDVFPPVICTLRHVGYGGRWANGSTRSPTMTARFLGHGGHYIVNYHWQLYR